MKINTNDPIILGRLIPDSGKIHQNQEVLETGVSMTIKSSHYKNAPKILVWCEVPYNYNIEER